jgi:oligo-1,6-glucosidase
MTVAEGPGIHIKNVLNLVNESRHELNMNYHFDHQSISLSDRHVLNDDFQNLVKFKNVMSQWDKALNTQGWNTIYLGNHDFPRMVSRWANDAPEFRAAASKMLTTYLLSMRGTPHYYMGDEIGMSNIKFDDIGDYSDLMTLNWFHLTKVEGGDTQALLESHKITGRDNARTPIQWDNTHNAGFTNGKPWLTVNPNYISVNVAEQQNRAYSELNYFRKIVRLRKDNLILVYGSYELLHAEHTQLYDYTRSIDDKKLLVLLNFSDRPIDEVIPLGLQLGKLIINNFPDFDCCQKTFRLLPYQSVIIEIE